MLLLFTLSLSSCIGPALEVLTDTLANGVVGATFSVELTTTSGASAVWAVTDGELPPGLDLDGNSGEIYGTPTTAGDYAFAVAAAAFGTPQSSSGQIFTITIHARLAVSVDLDVARVGESYSDGPTISGGVRPYTVTIRGLPAGLTYSTATGKIGGTPLNHYDLLPIEVEVRDSGDPGQTATIAGSLVVKPRGVSITTTELPDGALSTAYSITLAATDGKEPYTWEVQAGVLPSGLRLTMSTGVIAGTVGGSAGTQEFTILVTDADTPESSDTAELKIVVPVVVLDVDLDEATVGSDYSDALGAVAGLPPYTWSISAGALPDGLELDASSGEITGTVAAGATTQTFTVEVTDSDSPATTDTLEFTITVGA